MHCIFYDRLLDGLPIMERPSKTDPGKSIFNDLERNII